MTDQEINEAVARKMCTGCNKSLSIAEFNRNKRSPDGLDWKCKTCQKIWSKKWCDSERGRLYRAQYRKGEYEHHKEYKKAHRRKMALKHPQKVRARWLIGNAVRHKFIAPPISNRNWHNKYEFHHPDHSRPYYGCWVLHKDHVAIEKGLLACPPCIDYVDIIRDGLAREWNL